MRASRLSNPGLARGGGTPTRSDPIPRLCAGTRHCPASPSGVDLSEHHCGAQTRARRVSITSIPVKSAVSQAKSNC